MRSTLFALLTVLLGFQAYASEQILRACGAVATEEEPAVGLQALEGVCPGVSDALHESRYADFIGELQQQQLTRESLGDLLDLQARYQGTVAPHARPDPAGAAAIADLLQKPPPPVAPKSWLQSLRDWLRQYFSRQTSSDDWLSRWLRAFKVSDNQADLILAGLALLVAVAAVAVLIFELRAAGVLRGRSTRTVAAGSAAAGNAPALTLADLETAAVRDRAALLFKILVVALQRAGRVRAGNALTHREFSQRASFDDERQRQVFGDIATLAEGTLYGSREPGAAELEQAITHGRDLYAQLARPIEPPR